MVRYEDATDRRRYVLWIDGLELVFTPRTKTLAFRGRGADARNAALHTARFDRDPNRRRAAMRRLEAQIPKEALAEILALHADATEGRPDRLVALSRREERPFRIDRIPLQVILDGGRRWLTMDGGTDAGGIFIAQLGEDPEIDARLEAGDPYADGGGTFAFHPLSPPYTDALDDADFVAMREAWERSRRAPLQERVWVAGASWEFGRCSYFPASSVAKIAAVVRRMKSIDGADVADRGLGACR